MVGARIISIAYFCLPILLFATAGMAADRIRVGVSEFTYSDLVQQIGDASVTITLIDRKNATAQRSAVAAAQYDLILCGGKPADAWLCDAARHASRQPVVIEASLYASNQRITVGLPCYDLRTMSNLAQDVAKELSRRAPAKSMRIASNLAGYLEELQHIDRKIDEISKAYTGSKVFVTDNLSRSLIERLHFKIQDEAYIKGMQTGGMPSAKSIALLKDAIQMRKASILLYDLDATTAETKNLVAQANEAGIPVVGLREKLPSALHYYQWMLRQLNAIHGALNEASP